MPQPPSSNQPSSGKQPACKESESAYIYASEKELTREEYEKMQ